MQKREILTVKIFRIFTVSILLLFGTTEIAKSQQDCNAILQTARECYSEKRYNEALNWYNRLDEKCPNYDPRTVQERKDCKDKLSVFKMDKDCKTTCSGDGGIFEIKFDKAPNNWSVTNQTVDWLNLEEVDLAGKRAVFRVQANPKAEKRKGNITLQDSYGRKGVFPVEQLEGKAKLIVQESSLYFEGEGAQKQIYVNCNFTWKKENCTASAPWIILSKQKDMLVITCSPNDHAFLRTAEVEISGKGLSRRITINQAGGAVKDTYVFPNGDKYEGLFKNGIANGAGTMYFKNGNKYEGIFEDGHPTGQGALFYQSGELYVGTFLDGIANGQATLYLPNGERYEGEFRHGIKDGYGIYYWPDGDWYEGQFENGEQNGQGSYHFNDGDLYIGQFKNNQSEGKGIYYFSDGARYEGDFKEDLADGFGTQYYADGDNKYMYVGTFSEGRIDGTGTLYWTNGDKYEGEFRDGFQHGKGAIYWYDGDKYIGDFFMNMRTGSGKYYWATGDWYEGEFFNGVRDGYGTYHYADGDRYEGGFKQGKREGYGIYYFKNGDRFEGTFKNGVQDGTGKYYQSNGKVIQQRWENGRKIE